MPTLAGGKPHRTELTRLAAELEQAAPAEESAEPAMSPAAFTDPTLALLAEGWREVLGHDGFGESTHFFRAGGHSLLAAQLAAWLEPRIGTRPPMRLLFQNPVLADQARALEPLATAAVPVPAAATAPKES